MRIVLFLSLKTTAIFNYVLHCISVITVVIIIMYIFTWIWVISCFFLYIIANSNAGVCAINKRVKTFRAHVVARLNDNHTCTYFSLYVFLYKFCNSVTEIIIGPIWLYYFYLLFLLFSLWQIYYLTQKCFYLKK